MITELTCVKRDGTLVAGGASTVPPLYPTAQKITWPRAEDGVLRLKVVRSNRMAADITGASIVFALRKNADDGAAVISRSATITGAVAGTAEVAIVAADTLELEEKISYVFDVQLVDASGSRWQIVPPSEFEIAPIVAWPGDPVTVPAGTSAMLPWLSFAETLELETDGSTDEQVLCEFAANFDDIAGSLPNLSARLSAIAYVTAGAAVLRVRVGGTPGASDGTVMLETDEIVATADALVTAADTATKPVGLALVKVTAEMDSAETLAVRGLTFAARGAL